MNISSAVIRYGKLQWGIPKPKALLILFFIGFCVFSNVFPRSGYVMVSPFQLDFFSDYTCNVFKNGLSLIINYRYV